MGEHAGALCFRYDMVPAVCARLGMVDATARASDVRVLWARMLARWRLPLRGLCAVVGMPVVVVGAAGVADATRDAPAVPRAADVIS